MEGKFTGAPKTDVMQNTELLVVGRYVVTSALAPAQPRAGVLVRDGRVAVVGPAAELQAAHPTARRLGGDRFLVIPGLVNAHHHGRGLTSFLAGTPDDSLEPWIVAQIGEPALDATLDTRWAALRMLQSGVTTVNHFNTTRDYSRYAEGVLARVGAYRDAGLRVAFGLDNRHPGLYAYGDDAAILRRLPPASAEAVRAVLTSRSRLAVDQYLRHFADLSAAFRPEADRVRFLLAPTAPQWLPVDDLRRIGRYAAETGACLHTHCLETPYQRAYAAGLPGGSLIARMDDWGLLGPRTGLAHAVWATPAELTLLAQRGTHVLHNPSSNLRLRSGIAPVRAALAAGVNVALGTDGMTLANDDDLLREMNLALNLHRLPGGEAAPLTARQALWMATGAAAAAGPFAGEVGTLERGRRADMVLLDFARLAWPHADAPHDPVELLVQSGHAGLVDTVVVGGETLLQAGQPTRLDAAALAASVEAAVAAGAATRPPWAADLAAAVRAECEALLRQRPAAGKGFDEL